MGNEGNYVTDRLHNHGSSGWSDRRLRLANRIHARNLLACVDALFGTTSLSNSALQGFNDGV